MSPLRRLGIAVFACCLALSAACQRGDGKGGDRLALRWSGSDSGAVKLRAHAGWCEEGARLEVIAVRDDQGFGLAIYPDGPLAAGEFPAFDPGIDTAHRPGASLAARWYTDAAIVGYQSDSGRLSLTRAAEGYGAEFGFRLRSLDGEDTLRMTGRFRELVPGSCPADSLPAAPSE